ncbi:hypothetical protein SBOR_7507 [Sclerotinia borealis F-4128]|uniref:Small secreted protein n=1 Tax=Sclerotinia borealis (strain F-4128) TaxID=1432307 RepID=W9C8K2_SCLBF|nr:hypothetical protein SBOR_7507 [Sclerotinia borealis F-4128]
MKLISIITTFLLAEKLAAASPAVEFTARTKNERCVTQGPGTCTFGWQEYSNHNGHFESEASLYDNNCRLIGGFRNPNAADQYVTVTSENPPMSVSINGWAQPPQIFTFAIPKFEYNGTTSGGRKGCACGDGEGEGENFWGCRKDLGLSNNEYVATFSEHLNTAANVTPMG